MKLNNKSAIPIILVSIFTAFALVSGCSSSDDNNVSGGVVEDTTYTYYLDADGDGYGDADESVNDTSQPDGYVLDATDCDDTDPFISPAATEIPNDDIDQDCDGLDSAYYYADSDGDGYGDAGIAVITSDEPEGYVADSTDCDDTSDLVFPGAAEVCGDGIDQDCDGGDTLCDDDGGGGDGGTGATYFLDADGDGYGDPNNSIVAATQPAGYVTNNSDCDDTNATAYPGGVEVCGDGIDQDCDGEDVPCVMVTYYRDSDGDGYGDPDVTIENYSPPAGYVTGNTDCNDSDASVYPGAAETCGDGIDQDCDGIDLVCP